MKILDVFQKVIMSPGAVSEFPSHRLDGKASSYIAVNPTSVIRIVEADYIQVPLIKNLDELKLETMAKSLFSSVTTSIELLRDKLPINGWDTIENAMKSVHRRRYLSEDRTSSIRNKANFILSNDNANIDFLYEKYSLDKELVDIYVYLDYRSLVHPMRDDEHGLAILDNNAVSIFRIPK